MTVQGCTGWPGRFPRRWEHHLLRFGVSRITVRGAIEQLAGEGLVCTGYLQGRRGTIVRSRERVDHVPTDAINPDRPPSQRDSFEESAIKAGRRPSKKFVMRVEVAPPEIAARLGAAADELHHGP